HKSMRMSEGSLQLPEKKASTISEKCMDKPSCTDAVLERIADQSCIHCARTRKAIGLTSTTIHLFISSRSNFLKNSGTSGRKYPDTERKSRSGIKPAKKPTAIDCPRKCWRKKTQSSGEPIFAIRLANVSAVLLTI